MNATMPDFSDRLTGCLLGMAIGDALGTPRAYSTMAADEEPQGGLTYRSRIAPGGTVEVPAGQFSLNTELTLCLLETLVTSDGFVDPEMAAFRFENAIRQPQLFLPSADECAAIERAVDSEAYQDGFARTDSRYAGPAIRAIPVALAHSLSDLNIALLTREVMRATLITHCDPVTVNGALAVAHAIRLIVRAEIPIPMLVSEILSLIDEDDVAKCLRGRQESASASDVAAVVCEGIGAFVEHEGAFEATVERAVRGSGAAHLTGALAGALAGAHVGASGIPARLVDGLEGRAYVLMAAPALLRAAQMRAGLFFHLQIR